MRGSKLAAQVVYEQKKDEFWKKKAERMKCKIKDKMQCKECKYIGNCTSGELKKENGHE